MGDLHDEAHHMYTKLMLFNQSRIGQQDEETQKHVFQQRQNIYALILQFLCVSQPVNRFKYGEFTRIISDSGKNKTFEPEKAVQAFLCLEDYIVLLNLMPWKTEYHSIKKYGGHYQTKIAAHITGAEKIFHLVGFIDLSTGVMIRNHHTKGDVLQYIAFECLVASAECLIISQIWRKIDHVKLGTKDVVQIRLKNSGNAEAVISVIESKYGSMKCDTMEKEDILEIKPTERRIPANKKDFCQFRDKLQEHIKKAEKIGTTDHHHDIPYMDEDIKEIDRKPENLEDHILASIQSVSDNELAPIPCGIPNKTGLRASQEWSFVREGLEKNYGKKYFDGPREDILQKKGQGFGRDASEYVQIVAEVPYENVQSRMPGFVGNNSQSFYTGVDSAYLSSSTAYPPRLDDAMVKRGMSDTILRKDSALTESPKTQTAPILRKTPSIATASTTYPGPQRQANALNQLENILKYQKKSQSSMPIKKEQGPETSHGIKNYNVSSSANHMGELSNVARTNYSLDNTGTGARRDKPSAQVRNMSHIPASTTGYNSENSDMHKISFVSNDVKQTPVINYSSKTVRQSWECSYCTYINKTPDSSICSICFKTRDPTEVDGPVAGDVLRVCDRCTLENSPNSRSCKACGNELKSVQTVI